VTGDTGDSAAGALTLANLGSVLGQLEDGELEGAEWFMHPTTWARLRVLTGGASGNDHPYVAVDGPYKYTLMGFPVNLSNKATTTWASIAASGAIALFGNPKLIYIGTKNDIQVDSSEAYKFNYDQTVFRAIQRIAMAMALPGSMARLRRGPA
jgi:HK97 family phage major capsid protein